MRLILRLLAVPSLLALLSIPAFAVGAVGIDGMTQTVMQEGQSSFSGLGMRVRLQPTRLIKPIEIMPTIEYWRSSNTIQPYGIETMRKDATLAVDARYTFKSNSLQPYVGAGFAIHFLATRVNAPSLGLIEASDSVIKGGLAALGGVNFAITEKLGNFFELKYHHISDYRQLKINWGLSYQL